MENQEAGTRKPTVTMIESLVVAIVIVVLSVMVVCMFFSARGSARRTTCLSNLHQIGLALELYRSDWNDLPYDFVDWTATKNGSDPLQPYSDKPAVYHCPDNPDPKAAHDYHFRVALLRQDGPKRLLRPDAGIVTVFCINHLIPRTMPPPRIPKHGFYIVLRSDGSVKQIPARNVVQWGYFEGDWFAPGEAKPKGSSMWLVFPGEHWPPEFGSAEP